MTPKYYIGKYKKIEAFDVVLDFQEDNYNLATAITYLLRAGKKPNNPMSQDIKKAIAHLQRELEHQTHKSANHLDYFEYHDAAAKSLTNGMEVLYQQSDSSQDWLSTERYGYAIRKLRTYARGQKKGTREGARVPI